MSDLAYVINHSIIITLFVFVMMLVIDYLNVLTKGKMEAAIKGSRARQYTTVSLLGASPGCLGAFANVSFYIHGLISFGAIVGGMIATSGDEVFVMFALFPKVALILILLLFFLGILGAWISDKIVERFGIITFKECELQEVHSVEDCKCYSPEVLREYTKQTPIRIGISLFLFIIIVVLALGYLGPPQWNWFKVTIISMLIPATFIVLTVPDHYLVDHIWHHIVRKHLWRVFLWTFFALLFVTIGLNQWDIEEFIKGHLALVFLLCALIGFIPESGPHMVFVIMFANGIVPFSILLTSSIAQDGHGMLPMFSYSWRDALLIKIFNISFALVIGSILLVIGL